MAEHSKDIRNNDDDDDDDNEFDEFTVRKIANNVYLCREKHYTSDNVANLYVIQGTSMDVIIDTGVGLWDYRTFLERKGLISSSSSNNNNHATTTTTTSKPTLAIATHVHFDHSGGLYQFSQIAIHELEAHAIRIGDSFEAVCIFKKTECNKVPTPTWKPKDYTLHPANPTRILKHNDIVELGGSQQLQVLHLPGHSRGSIALWDETNGFLFSGDIVYDGNDPLIDWLYYSNINDYVKSMEILIELSPQVNQVFPGHNEIFDRTKLTSITFTYLNSLGVCHTCTATLTSALTTVLLSWRNSKNNTTRSCFHSCCCCCIDL